MKMKKIIQLIVGIVVVFGVIYYFIKPYLLITQVKTIDNNLITGEFSDIRSIFTDLDPSLVQSVKMTYKCDGSLYCDSGNYISPQFPHKDLKMIMTSAVICPDMSYLYRKQFLYRDLGTNRYYLGMWPCDDPSGRSPMYGPFIIRDTQTSLVDSFRECGDNPKKWLIALSYSEALDNPYVVCGLHPAEGEDSYGKVPTEIKNLKKLRYLFLSNNLLNSLPEEIGELTQLEYLFLSFNDLHQLPSSIQNLKNLKRIDLSGNKFSKSYESQIRKMFLGAEILLDRQRSEDGNWRDNPLKDYRK